MIRLTPIKGKATRLTADRVRKVIKNAHEDVSDDVLRDLTEITDSWENKPTFERRLLPDGSSEVTTDSQIFHWLNDGTDGPYDIVPKTKPRLVFQSQYTAKTTPGNVSSRAGGKSGPFVYAKKVRHPGIQARKWTKIIADKRNKQLKQLIDEGLRKIV